MATEHKWIRNIGFQVLLLKDTENATQTLKITTVYHMEAIEGQSS